MTPRQELIGTLIVIAVFTLLFVTGMSFFEQATR